MPFTIGNFATLYGVVSANEMNAALHRVKQFTAEIFACPFKCVEEEDCEIAGDRYFAFYVRDNSDVSALVRRSDEWHRQVAGLPSNVRLLFRLLIDAEE